MKYFFKGTALLVPLFAALAFSPSAKAAVIVEDALTNASFEDGPHGSVCPQSWICGGSPSPGAKSSLATSNEYTAGADGLSGSALTPDGLYFASTPTPSAGSGILAQQTAIPIIQGETYVLTFWLGTPLHVTGTPNNASAVGTFRVYFLRGLSAELEGGSKDFAAPTTPGQWDEYSFSYTAKSTGGMLGVKFFVDGGNNSKVVNLDMVPDGGTVQQAATPEPGSMALFGLGLVGLEVGRRFRKKA